MLNAAPGEASVLLSKGTYDLVSRGCRFIPEIGHYEPQESAREYRDKAQGKKGQGFLPVLEAAAIPTRTAYYWLEKYEVSAGLRKEETEFTTSSEAEDLRQMMREIDKGTHSRLTEDEKRFIHETAQRVHQRTTNPFANFTFSDLPKSIKLSRYEVCSRFIELLDYETLESAWKKMAAKYHPDRPSGNAAKATELNELWQAMKSYGWEKQ